MVQKYEIYCIINQLVAEGRTVILISFRASRSSVCVTEYIMDSGKIVGEVEGDKATQENIMSHILENI